MGDSPKFIEEVKLVQFKQRILEVSRKLLFLILSRNRTTVHLVGTNHECQYNTELSRKKIPFLQGGSSKKLCDEAFANFLAYTVSNTKSNAVAEEFSEESLQKSGDGSISVAKTIAEESGVAHIFCDPDTAERKYLESDIELDLVSPPDEELYQYRKLIGENYNRIDALRVFYRELFWLKKLSSFFHFKNIVFVCGADHIETFSKILKSRGVYCSIVVNDFCIELCAEYLPTRVYDPNIVGPFGICFECFTPSSKDYAFCMCCGRQSSHVLTFDSPNEHSCSTHKNQTATVFCNLCGKPKCELCYNSNNSGVAFSAGSIVNSCFSCIELMSALNKKYREKLADTGCCSKHFGRQATANCVSCQMPNCSSCLYYTSDRKSIRVIDGPFCLPCFRMKTLGSQQKFWISASANNIGASPNETI